MKIYLTLFLTFRLLAGYCQNQYDKPATAPTNQKFYNFSENAQQLQYLLEYKQLKHDQMKQKFETLEQRVYDLLLLSDNDAFTDALNSVLEVIQIDYKTDLSTAAASQEYDRVNRYVNECYLKFVKSKNNKQ